MSKHPDLKKRVITAVLGVPLLIGTLLLGGRFGAALVALVLSMGMLYEFSNFIYQQSDQVEKKKLLLGMSFVFSFVNFWTPRSEFEIFLVGFISLFIYYLFSAEHKNPEEMGQHFRELMASLFGMLYLLFLPFFLILIRDSGYGIHWTILFFLIVWAGDTGAYFSGLKYGKRRLYAAISPKKSVEGAVGGLACSVLVTLVYKLTVFRHLPWLGVLMMPVLVGVFAITGDLCESFLKRSFNVKDSGSLLPGHGGFLDRFDAVVFSLPVMYGCVRIFN